MTADPLPGATATAVAPDTHRYADDLAEEIEEQRALDAWQPEGDLPPDRFLDRERSWLQFNARVLELAENALLPLLERTRFLAIFASNLDEFFMVRVAGLERRLAAGATAPGPSGLSPREQLNLIATEAHDLVARHAACFAGVCGELRAQGIELTRWHDLHAEERRLLEAVYRDRIHPVLTPLAVDPAHPFPYISGLSLNLAIVVRNPVTGAHHFARVKVPPLLPRFVPVGPARFVPVEDVIAAHLPQLFTGMEVLEHHAFRVTRNEDLEMDADEAENLLTALERELLRRRFGPPVRLEVETSTSQNVLDLLVRELDVSERSVYRVPAPLDLAGLWPIADIDRSDLSYERFVPATHPGLNDPDADVFAALRAGDVLLHHPYDSFATSVVSFIEQAAADPHVLAIKLTLYRTNGNSPIVNALIAAAEVGKQVLVLVEIKARFDEQANIRWARKLEQAGCHVVYGLVGLKTHCKLCLVVRQEADGSLRPYVHVGTGNYNPTTARIYEDLGLLTADPAMGADVTDVFNHLSGYTRPPGYETLLVAPDTLRKRLIEMVEREVEHLRAGRPAGIAMKVNSLVDEVVVDALYDASRAGVPVDLVVRGMCALRPGVPGLSETVRVRSILGRFLEHSRVLCFRDGGADETWIGSADLMHRNLDRRVEVLARIADPAARAQLRAMFDLALDPGTAAWDLGADGEWRRTPGTDYQSELAARTRARPTPEALA